MQLAIDSVTVAQRPAERSGHTSKRSVSFVWIALCAAVIVGCKPQPPAAAPSLQFTVAVDPAPPKVGPAQLAIAVTDAEGRPVEGATVRVEGNMSHAGMKPSFADLTEEQPGRYVGTLEFTMGGDWFLLITTTTRDGLKAEHEYDVPGVESK